jgi:hypothetical protein
MKGSTARVSKGWGKILMRKREDFNIFCYLLMIIPEICHAEDNENA